MKLTLNISPCPNDTFMFDALINHRIDTRGVEFEVTFEDIENLNQSAIAAKPNLCKISYAILPLITDKYTILDSGSALGYGNGPLIVAQGARDERYTNGDGNARENSVVNLSSSSTSIAVPGRHTTANLLTERLFPALTQKSFMLFSEIAEAVSQGNFDAGVLIHEGRFTYPDKGLVLVADLGDEWFKQTSLPLPLGGIVASKRLDQQTIQLVEMLLRQSIEYAFANPATSREFVKAHAQEMDDAVIDNHINMFVNQFSLSLGIEGRSAVEKLTGVKV